MIKPAEARILIKHLRRGDVVLVSEKGLKHLISKLLQRSRWNHVMLYIGKGRTIESTPRKGAHICNLMHDLTRKPYAAYKVLRNMKLSQTERRKVVETALRLFNGKKYSWGQYFKIIIGRTLQLRGGNKSAVCTPNHKCNALAVACSNMVAMAYYDADFPVSDRYKPEYVVPKDYEGSPALRTVFEREIR